MNLHDDFSICEGCSVCDPPSLPAEPLPRLEASESVARLLHESVISFVPSSYLRGLADEADASSKSIEEVASERFAKVFREGRRFYRSLRRAGEARGLRPEELLTRMFLTGSMGPEVRA